MKENLTEIVVILDKSGSMSSLANDTIGGYNNFIKEQKEVEGEAYLTTVLFDDEYNILHNRVNIKEVSDITSLDYRPRGATALNDAIGKTINNIGQQLNAMDEKDKPSKVIFMIMTDGEENSSTKFTTDKIKEMVEHQKSKYNWEFIFVGANIDSFSVGGNYGISNVANYKADVKGVADVTYALNAVTTSYRKKGFTGNISELIKN